MLKAIVFDFDGVIVNSEPLHYRAFLRIGERMGVRFSYEEYLEEYVGFDDRDAFAHMLGKVSPGREANAGHVAELCRAKGQAFADVVEEGIEPIAGMPAFVQAAASQLPIAIASGATRADIDLILGKLGLGHLFGIIVTADDVAKSKPDPASYRLAVQKLAAKHPHLSLQPAECLAIEDTAAGIASARGAGLLTLGLTSSHEASVLRQAHRVIDRVEGLTLATLRQWFED
jgi:HAD superfamily hydrolase (TIGR01509 family)